MRAKERNNKNGRKTLLIIGLLVATLVVLQGNSWTVYGTNSLTQNLSLSSHVKGKVMFLGRLTKNVLNTFD